MAGSCDEPLDANWVEPDWPAPDHVCAISTTRGGGCSQVPYASLNLGDHVGDESDAVTANRRILGERLELDDPPRWLNQIHGNVVVSADEVVTPVSADAAITSAPHVVCAVMTADCLPILLCDAAGTHVAAVHGGWRGLAGGVIEAAIAAFVARGVDPRKMLCWLGPAIGPGAYEVGQAVHDALRSREDKDALTRNSGGRWQLDLYVLARLRLRQCGVTRTFGGDFCTYTDSERFFSHRRDGVCGRQASLIWRQH
jgi:YfiH family protein